MAGKNPHFVLIKILDQLRCVVMKMQPPVLTEVPLCVCVCVCVRVCVTKIDTLLNLPMAI